VVDNPASTATGDDGSCSCRQAPGDRGARGALAGILIGLLACRRQLGGVR
jgi:hypothetical protein